MLYIFGTIKGRFTFDFQSYFKRLASGSIIKSYYSNSKIISKVLELMGESFSYQVIQLSVIQLIRFFY